MNCQPAGSAVVIAAKYYMFFFGFLSSTKKPKKIECEFHPWIGTPG